MATLILFLKLFPLLLSAIQAIEAAAPVPAAGTTKLALLTTTVASGVASTDFNPKFSQDQFMTWLQTITATIVTFYNILGIFKKSSVAAPSN